MYACHNRLAALVAACTLIAGSLAPMPARTQSLDDEPHFYAGFGLSSGLYEVADLIEPFDAYRNDSELDVLSIDDARLSGLYGRFGYQIHPNVAIEGRLGVGSTGDSPAVAWITYDGGNTINFLILENLFELDLDNFVGVYGRFGGQVGSTYLYGMAGFSQVNVTAKLSGESISESVGSDGLSLGFGIDIPFSDSLTGTFERLVYFSDSEEAFSDISFNLTWNF